MTNMSNEELKHRILARKLELQAKLEHLKADIAGATADAAKCIEHDLEELGKKISQGWENLNASTVQDLNDWFKHTDSH